MAQAKTLPTPRAPFSSQPLPSTSTTLPALAHLPSSWIPVLSSSVTFSLDTFRRGAEQTALRPEYNSTSILRADILSDSDKDSRSSSSTASPPPPPESPWTGYEVDRRVRLKLLPRRNFDSSCEQDCLFLRSTRGGEAALVMLPDLELQAGEKLPFYHPQVGALAFRYLARPELDEIAEGDERRGEVRLEVVALPGVELVAPLDEGHRLYRTAMLLVQQLCKVSKGLENGYEKRVRHDLLSGKEEVQDVYRELKERYRADIPLHDARITFRWLLNDWKEATDPSKHVWEDVAIAAWLIVVWQSMYGPGGPPGGFVDVGCGNGLLVFILASEGYTGYGVDLRARKSWALYPSTTDLRTATLSPVDLLDAKAPPFPLNSFLVGNHADELTPWIPLFAASTPGASFLNIPCCLHDFTGHFTRGVHTIPPSFLASLPSPPSDDPPPTFDAQSTLPTISTDPHHSLLKPFYAPTSSALHSGRYFAYQSYLAHITLRCGFWPEREALRIPSTKNFGFLGRRRVWEGLGEEERREGEERVRREMEEIVRGVRGSWVARTPEGKAGGHC